MNRKIRVLVVDDNKMFRDLVADQLNELNIEANAVGSGEEALQSLAAADCDVVLLDIKMMGLSGLEVLRQIRQMEDAPEVIMLTADTSLSTGIEAMRGGAYDYLTKPATLDEMEAVIRKADEKRRLVRQNASLRSVVRQPAASEDESPAFIYQSEAMRGVVELAESAARLDSTVIITGESGTGKDVLARFIHARSARRDSP
ncbi:MAG TPA: response regulator, partial [Pyrinomonadaceae bacterium]|nr:response regulator [Pyrinomonadaceae bacterium]